MTTDPLRFASDVEQLFAREELDDPTRLLATRSWEEYPTFTRLNRIQFLEALDPIERSYVLFAHALAVLDRVVAAACATMDPQQRADFVAVLSIRGWNELDEEDPTPPRPSIFICSQVNALIDRTAIVRRVESPQGRIVAEWVDRLGQGNKWELAESRKGGDPDLFRVYVGHRQLPCSELLTLRDISSAR